jgi:hypothetical protein
MLATSMVALLAVGLPACNGGGTDRWVTTENSQVDIDWDAVGEAYKQAEGPEDFERRVNEIYAGDEVVSVSVKDSDASTQLVTGFFDKDEDGSVDEGEEIFTITRSVTGEGSGNYQIAGHGHYAGYHSPVWDIATGMLLGSMISRAFMPGYTPMYSQPYTTPASRRGELVSQRNSYRAANPEKFQRASKSGRSYGRQGGGFGGGRSTPAPRGGGRFGARRPATKPVVMLAD